MDLQMCEHARRDYKMDESGIPPDQNRQQQGQSIEKIKF